MSRCPAALAFLTVAIFTLSAGGADLVEDLNTPGAIGAGSGSAYVPAANWSVNHGLARLDPAGALGSGTGVAYLGDSAGVGALGAPAKDKTTHGTANPTPAGARSRSASAAARG